MIAFEGRQMNFDAQIDLRRFVQFELIHKEMEVCGEFRMRNPTKTSARQLFIFTLKSFDG